MGQGNSMDNSLKFNEEIIIGSKQISRDSPVFIIAEAGVNHNGDIKLAKRLINIAADSGADAVKFQAFKTEHLILKDIGKAPYQKVTTNSQESQFDMLKKLEITNSQNYELQNYCIGKDIIFLTTPFDEHSLEELDVLDLPAYKIASTDITNIPFLKMVAQKGKPMLLSTGMSYLSEISYALEAIHEFNKDAVLLQCTANYPTPVNEINLQVINIYKKQFNILVGYSDHSAGIGAAPYAVPMGAKIIEKHFTHDQNMIGPDHKASLSPEELYDFVKIIRKVETYMGNGLKMPTVSETKTRLSLQKYLVAKKVIKKGQTFEDSSLIAKRTGGKGISPMYVASIIGREASKDYSIDEIIDE